MAAGYASGLGELYVSPGLMTPAAWDALAESMRLARDRQAIVADTHWVGGDPRKNEIYGFAAWHPERGGVLTLRNPDDKPQQIVLDLAEAFEISADAAKGLSLTAPYQDQRVVGLAAEAGAVRTIDLDPFEVLAFDAK